MTKKITKIRIDDYSDSQVLTVDADKETISKIMAFVASLNIEIHTPTKDPTDNG